MDSALKQYDYLDLLLPSVLFAVLAILVAAVGIARWRPVMVTTSLVGFALLMVGGILSHSPVAATASAALADSSVSSTQQIFAIAALRSGIVLGMLAAFYTLIVAARAHQWAWFVGIGLAAIIGAAGAESVDLVRCTRRPTGACNRQRAQLHAHRLCCRRTAPDRCLARWASWQPDTRGDARLERRDAALRRACAHPHTLVAPCYNLSRM